MTGATPTRQISATPVAPPALTPESTQVSGLMNSCSLLDSRDVASLFTSAEVEGPQHQLSQVNHFIFSTENVTASEVACIFYVFHRPGKADEQMLQVSYWVDAPDPATAAAEWTKARPKTAQTVSCIGEDAFLNDGMLTFKQGAVFVTIGIVGTSLSTATPAGASQQVEMEKQIARDALGRLAG